MIFQNHYSGSAGNLYRVTADHGSILIDPGVPVKKIKLSLDFKLSSIQAALVTHGHSDHCKAVPDLLNFSIDCYMTAETAHAIGVKSHRLHIIEPGEQFSFGRWSAVAFEVQHDCPGAVGFLISDGEEKLLYATDTFYIRQQFRGVNIIAIECNYSSETMAPDIDQAVKKRLYRSHFSLKNVKRFLASTDLSKCSEIHLIHISNINGDPKYFSEEVEKLTGIPTYTRRYNNEKINY